MAEDFCRIVKENPYHAGNPVSKNEMFFGREQELKGIERVLNQDIKKVIRLRGHKRSGKTTILGKVMRDIKDKGVGYGIYCDFQNIAPKIKTNEDLPLQIGKAIIKNDEFDNFSDDFFNGQGDWTEKLEKLIKECLRKISPRKLVFLCDEYEALNKLFEPQHNSEPLLTPESLKWADNVSELPVYFIMAGSKEFGRILREKLEVHTEQIKIDTLLSYEVTKKMIEKPVEKELKYDEETIKRIYRLSGGHPFYIQQICKVIVDEVNVTLHCKRIEKDVLDNVIETVRRHEHGYITTVWGHEIHEQSKNMLRRLADMLEGADENEYRKPSNDILENQEVIESLIKKEMIEQRDADKAIRFTIDILRHWIQYTFGHEDITQGKVKPDEHEEEPIIPGIMKWIPAFAVIVMLFVGWVVYKYVVPHKKPPPVTEIADIAGFEFIICDYDEKNIQRLYLFRKPADKRLLLEKMKEPQKNPSISRDNQWLVFQSGGEADSKVIVANLRMRTTLDRKQQGKMPSISPDGTKIVYIKDSSMLTMELKNNGELSDTGPIELNLTHVDNPVYLYDNKSIAFIGAKDKDSRLSIFIYDTDGSFRYTHSDPGDKRIKEVKGTQSVEWLTASMNKSRILYSKDQKIYVKNL